MFRLSSSLTRPEPQALQVAAVTSQTARFYSRPHNKQPGCKESGRPVCARMLAGARALLLAASIAAVGVVTVVVVGLW